MAAIPERYIIGKDGEWYIGTRAGGNGTAQDYQWRFSKWDAKKFSSLREAKRKSWIVGGKVYAFNVASGETKPATKTPPKGAVCDKCEMYTRATGICRNPESEYYRTEVGYRDQCDEWTARTPPVQGTTEK